MTGATGGDEWRLKHFGPGLADVMVYMGGTGTDTRGYSAFPFPS